MMAGILTRNLPTGLLLLHGVKHWQIWMRVIGAYHAADPNAAIGRALENIAEFAGIKRRAASFSTTVAQFGGDGLIEVPAGTLIRHRINDTLWATDNAVITSSAGVVSVGVTCTIPGHKGLT